jgi:hypothetical protein
MFAALPPNQVYVYDLVGAGISTLVVAVAIPFLREEGSFLLLTGIAALPLLLHARATGERTYRSLGIAFAVGAAVLLVAHLTVDPFNLLRHARGGDKLFNSFYDSKGAERFDLLYSRGSLIERIDIVAPREKARRDRGCRSTTGASSTRSRPARRSRCSSTTVSPTR